jgi:hypothetical protein
MCGWACASQASQQGMLRGVSAVKVVGPLGAASSVYDKNWRCKACNAENYARRTRCVVYVRASQRAAAGCCVDHHDRVLCIVASSASRWRRGCGCWRQASPPRLCALM